MIPQLGSRLLVDANLLVLYIVGTVNPKRIDTFKRTSKYQLADYELLRRVLGRFDSLWTVAHVLAEVSNLTDLSGRERVAAREALKQTISLLKEEPIASLAAAEDSLYSELGLSDAAIGAVARANGCTVLTDDLELYRRLAQESVAAINFAHLQEQVWESR